MFELNIKYMRMFIARHKIIEACFVALILIVIVFPDVLFLGASFRLTDQLVGGAYNLHTKSFYHIPNSMGWWSAYNDNGGAIFQSEPMIQFMRHSLLTGQSPYWNPYSAAGSLGPETLVDQKFSAFTLLNVVLGADSAAYNIVTLLLFYFSVFFMYRLVREQLKLSKMAGIGVSLFYLLNGYSTANFGSNVTQSYFYIPMCLFVSLSFIEKPKIINFIAIIFSFAVLLSCTFIPTTIISIIAIYAIIIGFTWAKINRNSFNYRSGLQLIFLHFAALIVSILLLSILYIPILENISGINTFENYANRKFYGLYFPQAIASIFSPTHFYESYNAMQANARNWNGAAAITGNTVFHTGIVAIALASSAYALHRDKYHRLIKISAICIIFATCRLFEFPLIDEVISHIPVIGKIGCQYWWPAIMLPLAILLGFGIDNLQRHNFRIYPSIISLTIGVASIVYVYNIFGLHEPNINFKLTALFLLSFLTIIIFVLLLIIRFNKKTSLTRTLVFSLIIFMFIELMVDSKMVRFPRNDFFLDPPEALTYVQKNIGLYRTLNFGDAGLYPELGSAFNIQEITSMNQGVLPSYADYFHSAINLGNAILPETFPTLRLIQDTPSAHQFNWPALDLLGVKYILLPVSFVNYRSYLLQRGLRLVYETSQTLVFENTNLLPRTFAINLSPGYAGSAIQLPMKFRDNIYPAKITAYQNTAVEIKGTSQSKMLVVLSDNWHKNWSATVNGIATPILKVNGTLRGIVVSEGDYIIKMKYQPRSLIWAIYSSSGVLFLLIFMIFYQNRVDEFIRRRLPTWT